MRSAPETDNRKDSLRSIVENDPLITLWKAKATILAATDVSVSQQPVRVILETLEYSCGQIIAVSCTVIFH